MILVDANLLLYAANRAAPEHAAAREWLDARLSGSARVGLPWPSLLAFVRLATNPIVVRQPVSAAAAGRRPERGWAPNRSGSPAPRTSTPALSAPSSMPRG